MCRLAARRVLVAAATLAVLLLLTTLLHSTGSLPASLSGLSLPPSLSGLSLPPSLPGTPLSGTRTLEEALAGAAQLRRCVDVMRAPPHGYREEVVLYRPRSASMFAANGTLVARNVAPASLALPEGARNLMVVAHADDELLFGGSDLLAGPPGSWLLVISNRVGPRFVVLPNITRAFELAGAITLEHFEKWQLSYYDAGFVRDLHELLRRRSWETVVTHQLLGEYGNTQHSALHIVVSALVGQPDVDVRTFRQFQFHPRGTPPPAIRASEAVYARLAELLHVYGEKIVASFSNKIRMSGPSVPADRAAVSLGNLTSVLCGG